MAAPSITLLLTLLDDSYYLPEWAECVRRIAPTEVLAVDGGSKDGGAERFLRAAIPNRCETLVSVHLRRVPYSPERNLNAALIRRILAWLRRQGRVGFILLGRDDGGPAISGPDVFSFVGKERSFEQTAAIIARTQLFIGGESGLTHTAAALGVPLIGLGFIGHHARPFTKASRYVYFQKGDSPQTIMAEVKRFVERLHLCFGRKEKG